MTPTRTRWGWLALATVAPALWIGGVHPWVVPVFGVVVACLWQQTCARAPGPLRLPWGALVGVFTATIVLLQWLPFAPLRQLDPLSAGMVDEVLAGSGIAPWPGMSVTPGDTAVEAGRVIGLTVLFVAAAQVSWRVSAALVVVTATAAAAIGFGHELAGATTVYGVYVPQQVGALGGGLRVPFINENHQASMILLGLFCAGALAVDQGARARRSPDPDRADRYRDRVWLCLGSIGLLAPALVLTLSRGGIVAAAVVVPAALWLALRRRGSSSRRRQRWRWPAARTWMIAAGVLALLGVVAQHEAWAELSTLADVDDPESSAARKIALAGEALGLVAWSRPLGIGRGAFKDLFGAIEADPGATWYAYIESMPVALVVELGWLAGTVIVVALAVWWVDAFRGSRRHRDVVGRRIALLGLLALALHGALEFSLETLGVAAPAVALAGGLSGRARRISVASVRWPVTAALAVGIAIAAWGVPRAFAARADEDAVIHAGGSGTSALPMRPLDGRLLGLLAREAAASGDWTGTQRWAALASARRPSLADPWLLRAAAARHLGDSAAADAATRRGLACLHRRPDDALVEYLLRQYPTPEDLAAVAPVHTPAWSQLVGALRERAPAHADAIAAARLAVAPDDAGALAARVRLAQAAGRAALTLHHARLWRAADPAKAASHLAVARALRSFDPPRLSDARGELDMALRLGAYLPAPERAEIEEELVRVLVALGDPPSLARAHEIGAQLRSRPGNRAAQRRRAKLVRELEAEPAGS